MYPIALYAGLPEIAYLAPRGNFLARRLTDEDEPEGAWGKSRNPAAPEAAAEKEKSEKR